MRPWNSLDAGNACLWCGRNVVEDRVPDVGDDAAWAMVARNHEPTCEFVERRGRMGSPMQPDGSRLLR